MHFVILNIVLSSVFVLAMRWYQVRDGKDIMSVGAVNYITGWILALVLFSLPENRSYSTHAITWGAVNGVGYFAGFFLLLGTMKLKGAAKAAVFARLSIIVPIAVGVAFWGERPNVVEWVGIVLASMSLILLGHTPASQGGLTRAAFITIALFFMVAGGSRLAQESFNHLAKPQEQFSFLVANFTVSALGSAIMLWKRNRWPTWHEYWMGGLVGTSNVLQTLFILKALDFYPGFIVFPIVAAGGLLLTTVVAVLWLSEKISTLSYAGILLAVVSVVILKSG